MKRDPADLRFIADHLMKPEACRVLVISYSQRDDRLKCINPIVAEALRFYADALERT